MSEVKLSRMTFVIYVKMMLNSVRYKWENVMQNYLYKYVTESLKAVLSINRMWFHTVLSMVTVKHFTPLLFSQNYTYKCE